MVLPRPLLGANQPMGTGSEAGIYASGGSASAGGTGRFSNGHGLSLLGGVAWAREEYPNADLKNSFNQSFMAELKPQPTIIPH